MPLNDLQIVALGFNFPPGMSSAGGGFWNVDFFGPEDFDADYWEQGTSAGVLYATLLEALLASLNGTFSGSFPGGFWSDFAPIGVAIPYVVVNEIGQSSEDADTSGTMIDSGELQISIYSNSRSLGRTLGNTLKDTIEDLPLAFMEGNLMYLRQESRIANDDPSRDPSGKKMYQEIRTFAFKYSRTVGV